MNGIGELREHINRNLEDVSELSGRLDYISKEKEAVREKYGIDQDSQEQKDLELLEKYQNNRAGVSDDSFSKEEIERLRELQNIPLTDYQKEVLKLNSTACEISVSYTHLDVYKRQQVHQGVMGCTWERCRCG